MNVLAKSDSEVWTELERGKWAPNKSGTPFCHLGADEALEQENRQMKIRGGIVGITQNVKTLMKFFLTSPELTKICSSSVEAREFGKSEDHHEANCASSTRYKKTYNDMMECLQNHVNPFTYDGEELLNIITMTVAPLDVTHDVSKMPDIGLQEYQKFVNERIIHGTKNFWDPFSQRKLKLCKSLVKKVKVSTAEGIVEIKDDKKLFNRLVVLCRSRPDINFKECIGKYELTAVPRSLFSSDGTMHKSHAKSKLMHHLEELCTKELTAEIFNPSLSTSKGVNQKKSFDSGVAIIDGMAELYTFIPLKDTKSIGDLAEQFSTKILMKYSEYSEIHIVFDTYFENSLKNSTRERRQHGNYPIMYKVEEKMSMKTVTMKKLLSHYKNKDLLTVILCNNLLRKSNHLEKTVIVSYRSEIKSNKPFVEDMSTSQEEADTKLILHAILATQRGAQKLVIFSPDTDVLILTINKYPELAHDTTLILTGPQKRKISINLIYQALGQKRAEALLGMHSLSGCDTTGSFSGKSKTSFWKAFINASDIILKALASLGQSNVIDSETYSALEEYVCSVYMPKLNIKTLSELRWWFFTKKQMEGANMPPTQAALKEAIRRAHYQAIIWQRAHIPKPNIPPPTDFGWMTKGSEYLPVMCDMPCAPQELASAVRCSCVKLRCLASCKCSQNGVPCTEMCSCSAETDKCDNVGEIDNMEYDDSDIEDPTLF